MSNNKVIALEPAQAGDVADWDAEDMLGGTLAALVDVADPEQAHAMLSAVRLEIPDVIEHTELTEFAANRGTPLAESLVPDLARYEFHLVELPLTILIPENTVRLVRLRVTVTIDAGQGAQAVAYDLFPRDESTTTQHDIGSLSLDVAKALTFVSPVVGDVLGLKLTVPFKWTSTQIHVRTSDRLSNPVDWYVTDRSINQGFTGYLITRSPKGAQLRLHATVVCELRKDGLVGMVTRSRYRSAEMSYDL